VYFTERNTLAKLQNHIFLLAVNLMKTQLKRYYLIMSLVSTAMYQLGMATRPGEPPPPADLPAARETIDLLAMLQQKTQGNLTHEEEQLLAGSLQELRLVFVEISRHSGRIR